MTWDWPADSEGRAYESEIDLLLTSSADGLGLCGCGDPEHVGDMMCRYLEAVDWAWQDWGSRYPKLEEQARLSPDAFLLCAYLADMKNLTEHGGSVNGAWLSDKGHAFAKALRAAIGRVEP